MPFISMAVNIGAVPVINPVTGDQIHILLSFAPPHPAIQTRTMTMTAQTTSTSVQNHFFNLLFHGISPKNWHKFILAQSITKVNKVCLGVVVRIFQLKSFIFRIAENHWCLPPSRTIVYNTAAKFKNWISSNHYWQQEHRHNLNNHGRNQNS